MTYDPRAPASAERSGAGAGMGQNLARLAQDGANAPGQSQTPARTEIPPAAILAPSSAATLSALTASVWTPVAVRYRGPDTIDGWDWYLSDRERLDLHCGVRDGVLLMAQRRRADGVWELVARRVRGSERRVG